MTSGLFATARLFAIVSAVFLIAAPASAQQTPPASQDAPVVASSAAPLPYGTPIALAVAKKVMAAAEAEAAKNNWQVVMAAFLRQVGRRHIDGDAARGQRQAGCDQGRAHPLARFGDRLVGQADDMKGGQAGRHLHLHIDIACLDALEGYEPEEDVA